MICDFTFFYELLRYLTFVFLILKLSENTGNLSTILSQNIAQNAKILNILCFYIWKHVRQDKNVNTGSGHYYHLCSAFMTITDILLSTELFILSRAQLVSLSWAGSWNPENLVELTSQTVDTTIQSIEVKQFFNGGTSSFLKKIDIKST